MQYQQRPFTLVGKFIKKHLQLSPRTPFDHGSMCVKSPRRFKLVQQESQTFEWTFELIFSSLTKLKNKVYILYFYQKKKENISDIDCQNKKKLIVIHS